MHRIHIQIQDIHLQILGETLPHILDPHMMMMMMMGQLYLEKLELLIFMEMIAINANYMVSLA